ncbi:MAG: RagB/SusD family nutrient uptake outer membrane protein [Bacteroidales bacterium]|nr:RagB/SusD family nutrient uptake outer membrane protein [Bacteroidales bacterium]
MAGMAALGMLSCEKFLDRPAEDSYNTSNFYLNDEQCIQGVNYIYNSPWYDFQRGFIKIGEVMSGNMYWGSSPYMNFTTNATDENLKDMSYSLWAVNGHVNAVLVNINAADGPSRAVKNQCMGEAITLKALAYFFMVRTFGEIPIVHSNSELLGTNDYNNIYKVTRKNAYEYIIMNLEKAMSLLPKKTSGWDNRIDYYAAEALLSKVYLTMAGIDGSLDQDLLKKAAMYAKDVIDNSGRTLTPTYSDIFRLSPSLYNQTGEPLISWMWTVDGNQWTRQNTLQSDLGMVGFDEFGDVWGQWGGPSVDLMDAFGVSPADNPSVRATEQDKRRKVTMMMAGDFYPYFWQDKGGFDVLRFMYDAEYGAGGPGEFCGPCGAQNCKHLYGNNADHESALGKSADRMAYELPTHILRLADVYLIYAEASFLTGNTADALEYVNKVRERAGVTPLTSLTVKDIWKERRLELAGEGDYWYDFVRRSYYDMAGVKAELKAQRRNAWWNLNSVYKTWYESGKKTWEVDETECRYDSDTPAPNVTDGVFTLPFPQEDVVNNPHLLEPAKEINVRETYSYNF